MNVLLARPSLRRGHERSRYNKKDAPAKQHGLGEKYLQAEECGQSYVCSPVEARAMPAPTSESPEEREFVVDSGASINAHAEQKRI